MRSTRLRGGVALAVWVLAGACGGGSSSSSGDDGGTPPPKGPVARFTLSGDTPPNFLDVPFPSDVYLTGGAIQLPGLDQVVHVNSKFVTHELARTNGFSREALADFYVDDTSLPLDDLGDVAHAVIDPTTLPTSETECTADASSVFVLDLAATDPAKARIPCRAAIHDDTARFSKTRPFLAAGPGRGVLLEEAHRYAVVLTSRIKTTSGAHVAASADLQGIAGGSRSGSVATMYGKALDTVKTLLRAALASDGAQVVSIAPYTTMAMTHPMFDLRESLDAMPAPVLKWDAASMAPMGATKFAAPVNGTLPAGFTALLDDWLGIASMKLADGSDDPDFGLPVRAHDKIAALGTAVFQAANFLISKPGGYSTLDHATFTYDASGHIVPAPDKPTAPIWLSFAVPRAPMPASGYPCVIVMHGAGGSRSDYFIALANVFAAKGWMTVGLDGVVQGARAPEAIYQVDTVTDWQSAPGAKYAGPDGFADHLDANNMPIASPSGSTNGQLDLFGQVANFGAIRDQIRQQEIDITQVVRVLGSSPDLSPLQTGASPPMVDPTELAFVGGSMGAITGAVAAGIEPNVDLWALNVGAGGVFANDGVFGPGEGSTLGAGIGVTFALPGDFFDSTHWFATLAQTVFGSADPIEYAPELVTSPGSIHGKTLSRRNILATSVLYDAAADNETNEALARAAGLGLATPNQGTNSGVRTLAEVRDPTKIPDRVKLQDAKPDGAGLIHDTPSAGVTAVLVQSGPGVHYQNLIESTGKVSYAIPFTSSTESLSMAKTFDVRLPYVAAQAAMTRFFADGFAGMVPNVTGFQAPIRDYDDDGVPDATDPDPSDPTIK